MNENQGDRRSSAWFGLDSPTGLIHRSWLRNQGIPASMLDGRPVVGICNSWSELTPCNAHLRDLADYVKRGVYEAGGLPLEFPVMSLGETLMRPTTMLYRNLVSMDVEESIRANPIDGVVLLCGCDKTTPALAMGAASVDLPTIVVSGGPMLNGKFEGATIGSGTSLWSMSDDVRAGRMTMAEMAGVEAAISRSAGSCMTMGTASSMAAMMEAMGLALPQNGAIPAVDSRRRMLAHESGRAIVDLVERDVRLSALLTRSAFENALRLNAALGGSTNVAIHLLAIAGRVGVALDLDDIDHLNRDIPLLADVMPGGGRLMEDFYYAGGVPAVMRRLGELIDRSAPTVTGTIGDMIAGAPCWDDTMIRPMTDPIKPAGGIAVLRGNLAPDGAVLKLSAVTPALLTHRGPALVFDGVADLKRRIDDPSLGATADSVLILRGAGPRGYPGMPEAGSIPIPATLLAQGVKDMVRISDARMSGTSGGTAILHVAPEAAVGGPLALVRDGDMVELDVAARRLHLDISPEELAKRGAESWQAPSPVYTGGYADLYQMHVQQADRGADFDFLIGCRGSDPPPAY
ncbi:IlvD/Edd family dehydratase [Sphingomonas colocasiae]|uniref:Dihydroxy-acid dehydratase n=1 Tax=Sphingomonas colocasiae TaxID=1848973 RepID=A0ABS7PVM9_9SPHN|nr:dihydroxy-acid dehydratase [Sphingomonas colocasiae]